MTLPRASIIIPTWHGREVIGDCLAAVSRLDFDGAEVLVVDNAPAGGTADLVAEEFPQVRLLRNRRNLGFAGACNAGIAASRGPVLALLNQDAVVEPDWLRHLVDALGDPQLGIVGGKSLYPDGVTIQAACGSIFWPLGTAFDRAQFQPDEDQWDRPGRRDFVSGTGLAFRRDVLEAIGALDPLFWPGYFEDVDLCFRARSAGFEVGYVPAARLCHAESSSFRRWTSIWRFHHRHRLHFVLKSRTAAEVLACFVPAERLAQPALLAAVGRRSLARAYLEAAVRSLPVLVRCGHFAADQAPALLSAFRDLAASALERRERFAPPSAIARSGGREATVHALHYAQILLEQHHSMYQRSFAEVERYALSLRAALDAHQEEAARQVETLNREFESQAAAWRDERSELVAQRDEAIREARSLHQALAAKS